MCVCGRGRRWGLWGGGGGGVGVGGVGGGVLRQYRHGDGAVVIASSGRVMAVYHRLID